MAQSGTTEKRSPWPYLIGLILIIIVLYYIIRGLGPDQAAPLDEDASMLREVPVMTGTRAA